MDRDKLKLMVRKLELLVDDIKAEVFSDVQSYVSPPPIISQAVSYTHLRAHET